MSSPEYQKAWREKNKEKVQAYNQSPNRKAAIKAYTQTEEYKTAKKISSKKWHENHAEKLAAGRRVPERRYQQALSQAKKRELEFSISFDYWLAEVQKPCYYCQDRLGKRSETSVGLDRLDNSKGYVEGNVRSCCEICNKIKLDKFTAAETIVMVAALLNFRLTNSQAAATIGA